MPKAETHHAETLPTDLIGAGGELHQVAGGTHPQMTTNQGMVIADDENSLRANTRGPTLLEDVSSWRSCSTSTTSAYPSVSSTPVAPLLMAISS